MFVSILFPEGEEQRRHEQLSKSPCYKDLFLDQIISPIIESNQKYNLADYFFSPLQSKQAIVYRQRVLRDLEDDVFCEGLSKIAETLFDLGIGVRNVRSSLTQRGGYDNTYLERGRLLNCAEAYCRAVAELKDLLASKNTASEGMQAFCEYVSAYFFSPLFIDLREQTVRLRKNFSAVKYCMLIKNGTLRVRQYEGEEDHSQQIIQTFDKFRQGGVKDYRHKLTEESYAVHVETAVLNLLARLYPRYFEELDDFCEKNLNFMDDVLLRFAREIRFYMGWLQYLAPMRGKGLPFCYPAFQDSSETLFCEEFFDLALASKIGEKTVTNSFRLSAPERIMVLTGPNQGGKTTFARAFGQIHVLGALGLCVPGTQACLCLFDRIYTHFAREEDLSSQNGKLQDDLIRLRDILETATSRSIVIINEIFSSTVPADALSLGTKMMDSLSALGAPSVLVTFLDELALHGEETVSMMSEVSEIDPKIRTYRILRKPPDGLAYAMQIANKYSLSYEKLSQRLKEKQVMKI